jgi:hypothetical protein
MHGMANEVCPLWLQASLGAAGCWLPHSPLITAVVTNALKIRIPHSKIRNKRGSLTKAPRRTGKLALRNLHSAIQIVTQDSGAPELTG